MAISKDGTTVKYYFSIGGTEHSGNRVPIVHIEDRPLAVVKFELVFETKTDKIGSGKHELVVSGYFREERPLVLRTYKIDLKIKECVEVKND